MYVLMAAAAKAAPQSVRPRGYGEPNGQQVWWRRGVLEGAFQGVPASPVAPAPEKGERCPKETSASGKPKAWFEDEADALRFIEKNRHRYALDHAYECPYYHHWHVS